MTISVNTEQQAELFARLVEWAPRFVETLTGSATTPMHVRLIPERSDVKGGAVKNNRLVLNKHNLGVLFKANLAAGVGVFCTVNAFQGPHATEEDLSVVRATAADFDCKVKDWKAPLNWVPQSDVAGQAAAWDSRWLLPTMQVDSKNGPHLWWVYQKGFEPTGVLGKQINKALARLLPSDPASTKITQVLRIPGFLHWKDADPFQVRLTFVQGERVYKPEQLVACIEQCGHALIQEPQATERNTDGTVNTIQEPPNEAEYAEGLRRCGEELRDAPFIQEGHRDEYLAKKLCQLFLDWWLRDEDALKLLTVWNRFKCQPPLEWEVIANKWASARFWKRNDPIGIGYDRVLRNPDSLWDLTTRGPTEEVVEEPGRSEDETQSEASAPTPERKKVRYEQVEIEVAYEHGGVIDEVIKAISRDGRLYQQNGELVRPVSTSSGVRLIAQNRYSVMRFITTHCRFWRWAYNKKTEETEKEECGVPAWLAAELVESKIWKGLRPLQGFAKSPYIKKDGSVAQNGYDSEYQRLYYPSADMKNLAVKETQDDALQALNSILDVIADFPLVGPAQQAAAVAAMLTPFCRMAINGSVPLFLVDGNKPDIGKSKLLKVFMAPFRGDVTYTSWLTARNGANAEYHNIHKITSAIVSGNRVIAFDNISGEFGDPVLDRLITADEWHDREMAKSNFIGGANFLTVYGTANNVQITSDLHRRVLPIRLVVMGKKRTQFRWQLEDYLPTVRKQLVEACLTILRAFCLAGRPQLAKHWGSFEGWCDWVASALVWLGMPDVTQLVEMEVEDDSPVAAERQALILAVETLQTKLNRGEAGVSAQELAEAIQEGRRNELFNDYTALSSFMSKRLRHAQDAITKVDVSYLLRRHRDNTVGDKVLLRVRDKSHRASAMWRVANANDTQPEAS